MIISRFTLLLLLLCFLQIAGAQSILSRVTFPIDQTQTIHTLAKAGIDLTHGDHSNRDEFTTELSTSELATINKLGIRYTTIIPDVSKYRLQHHPENRGGEEFLSCQNHHFDEHVPQNFELGTKGGFLSYSEVLDNLDAMAFLYPNLISGRKPIGNFKTYGNNSLFWVRISDNAETDEQEPEILYTGLHHAREFISVSELIYYMWYLLENYNSDPLIKQIIDHTELYFVPVVNPDGLIYNADGYDPVQQVFTRDLRKNMRDNDGDGIFNPDIDGVDLNRNYGHEWGHDDDGSSGYEGSINYRGPSAFSEPETQALRYLCDTHEFKVAINAHSYGDLLIYPWGYSNSATPDSTVFNNYGELLSKLNGFVYGLGLETVGYITNGDSDDWMYGEEGIFSMTDEIGDPDDGFYPLPERIIPLCQSTLNMNLLAARLVNSLIQITDETPKYIKPGVNDLDLEFNRYGLLNGEVEISFHALSPLILALPDPIQIDMAQFEPHEQKLSFEVDNQIPYGASVKIEILCQQGAYTFRDTLTKTRADFKTLISDDGSSLNQWKSTGKVGWGLTKNQYKSGPSSITDSPAGDYLPNSNEPLVLVPSVDLTNTVSAYAQFWAKWDVEDFYDYVVFQASTDGENWQNLCGEQSRFGSLFQLYQEPLYDGKQARWVFETTDLSSYIGHVVQLRFLLVSDGYAQKDGFYFDDFKVISITDQQSATPVLNASSTLAYPNPVDRYLTIQAPDVQHATLHFINNLGESIYRAGIESNQSSTLDIQQWPAGLYYYTIEADGRSIYYGTVSVVH